MHCPKCSADNREAAKFCDSCGSALLNIAATLETSTGPASTTGERRHLTVLFCDLVNSTGIAAQLDPEDWQDMVAGYHRAAAEAITRFGGYVAHTSATVSWHFSAGQRPMKNDAERAARASLAILEAVLKLNHNGTRPELTARVGIDSGSVVVTRGSQNANVFGEVPNIAARVQAAAAPGTVVITAACQLELTTGCVSAPNGSRTRETHTGYDPIPSEFDSSAHHRGAACARRLSPSGGVFNT
jgi:class 3 adenylate cyclase